jgi:hypothetical protein
MTNSATSTDPRRSGSGFHAWQFFALASLAGATIVVMLSPPGMHPIGLILLSAAVIAAGLVGMAISRAVSGFFSGGLEPPPLPPVSRDVLEREKNLVLRSIKELEFDKAMGKVSEADFAAIMARLRARALTLMRDLERTSQPAAPAGTPGAKAGLLCPACRTSNDADARFCKKCGTRLDVGR